MADRDVEKAVPRARFVEMLRRLADSIESGEPYRVQVAQSRFTVPLRDAELGVEHEIEGDHEELALEVRWTRSPAEE